MKQAAITGSGLYVPGDKVTNEALVAAFNEYVDQYNADHQADIEAGLLAAKSYSSAAFIEKASGIKARHMIEGSGPVDSSRMKSRLPEGAYGDDNTPSVQAHMAIQAATQALDQANLKPEDIDLVICSAAVMQRYFPAMGIEIQKFLGTKGSAYDMIMACSSATFALINGVNAIQSGAAKKVLMVNPEMFSTMVNFRDRDSHFIFGDIATACVIEAVDETKSDDVWAVINTAQETQLSENIYSNFGPLSRLDDEAEDRADQYFVQEGRKVFKELLPLVTNFIERQLGNAELVASDLARMWLHQANVNMNLYAARKLLGREPEPHEAPIVLENYGNTAGAGSVVAFHEHRNDLKPGDTGLICSFGAGYSIGGLLIQKQEPSSG